MDIHRWNHSWISISARTFKKPLWEEHPQVEHLMDYPQVEQLMDIHRGNHSWISTGGTTYGYPVKMVRPWSLPLCKGTSLTDSSTNDIIPQRKCLLGDWKIHFRSENMKNIQGGRRTTMFNPTTTRSVLIAKQHVGTTSMAPIDQRSALVSTPSNLSSHLQTGPGKRQACKCRSSHKLSEPTSDSFVILFRSKNESDQQSGEQNKAFGYSYQRKQSKS